ncbi:MAG: homoserine kinase [Acidobacteria bacterium]|nr:homoserine kinase [Acidobacteriota bacterium]
MNEITVFPPATVANVVCGFDCLGFALDDPVDAMTLRLTDEKGVRITHLDDYGLPADPERNIAGVALLAMLDAIHHETGFELEITKKIKPGSGVGSSSASAVGAVVAADKLLNERFSRLELAEFAMRGEQVASAGRHADNVAPCLYGGFTLVRSVDPLDIVELEFPEIAVTVIHPQIEVKTADARRMLPAEIPLKSGVRAWSNVGALVAALAKGDLELLARSLEDAIVEPVRKTLIPHFDAVKTESLRAGALGGGISGSGPSIFMLSENQSTARRVAAAMDAVYAESGIDFNIYVTKINSEGVKFAGAEI